MVDGFNKISQCTEEWNKLNSNDILWIHQKGGLLLIIIYHYWLIIPARNRKTLPFTYCEPRDVPVRSYLSPTVLDWTDWGLCGTDRGSKHGPQSVQSKGLSVPVQSSPSYSSVLSVLSPWQSRSSVLWADGPDWIENRWEWRCNMTMDCEFHFWHLCH